MRCCALHNKILVGCYRCYDCGGLADRARSLQRAGHSMRLASKGFAVKTQKRERAGASSLVSSRLVSLGIRRSTQRSHIQAQQTQLRCRGSYIADQSLSPDTSRHTLVKRERGVIRERKRPPSPLSLSLAHNHPPRGWQINRARMQLAGRRTSAGAAAAAAGAQQQQRGKQSPCVWRGSSSSSSITSSRALAFARGPAPQKRFAAPSVRPVKFERMTQTHVAATDNSLR